MNESESSARLCHGEAMRSRFGRTLAAARFGTFRAWIGGT
jgi:hypothetical protein